MISVGSCFSGIGGLDLGLERAGMKIKWQIENDDFCNKILERHWPEVKRYGDIKTVNPEELKAVDLVCGGFPCQPHSVASPKRKQTKDERWLWPEMFRLVKFLRPAWVVGENPMGILNGDGGSEIRETLESIAYEVLPIVLPACSFGAHHQRKRVFFLAYSKGVRREVEGGRPGIEYTEKSIEAELAGCRANPLWLKRSAAEFLGVANGFPDKLDKNRVAALGNAVVPQVAEWVGRMIIMAENL